MIAGTPSAEERRRAATEQAAAWLVALRSGPLSAGERGEFIDWLRESPVHIAEMLHVSQVDHALGAFDAWDEIPKAEQTVGNVVHLMGERRGPPPRRIQFPSVARRFAAGLAIVALGAWSWLALEGRPTTVQTQLAEQREMTLADGSTVTIAPLSEMRIRFTSDARSIELRSGHALFEVSPDPHRPFIVDAGSAVVRAIGTSFDVDRGDGAVRVAVVKGRVLVTRSGKASTTDPTQSLAAAREVKLDANQAVVVRSRASALQVRSVDGAAQAAWTTGTLVFEDETVAEVAHRFNLHNLEQVRILDAQLAQRRISGTFEASDPESFVAFIRETSTDFAQGRPVILLEPRSR